MYHSKGGKQNISNKKGEPNKNRTEILYSFDKNKGKVRKIEKIY